MPRFFENSYEKNALLQKGFNAHIINDLVEYLFRVCPHAKKEPIKILDLCCGDGGVSTLLYLKLRERGILIEQFIGSDISPAQIDVANKKYGGQDPKLSFRCEDALATKENNVFDVVISLFGLHWISDIKRMSAVIDRALKPAGKFICFIPLEKPQFFAFRQSLVSKPKWSAYFKNFDFRPFIQEPHEYIEAFEHFFELENIGGISGTEPVRFSVPRFKQFLSSWMQELRHLPEEKREDYLNDLLLLLPTASPEHRNDVEFINKEEIIFHERFLWVHAVTKKAPLISNSSMIRAKL